MKTRILLLVAVTMLLSSCVGFTFVTVPQSNINFVGKDFETQRHVQYTLTKTYIFGIGGMTARARNTNVVKELMKKANLQKNEALAYITISKNPNTFLGIITTVDIVASGYVVRPVGEYDSTDVVDTEINDNVLKQGNKDNAKIVTKLRDKILLFREREELIALRKEVEQYHKNNELSDKTACRLLDRIDSKIADCRN